MNRGVTTPIGTSPVRRFGNSVWFVGGLDLAACVALLFLGLHLWPHGAMGQAELPDGAPAWATLQDYLFDGLDAGEWADQTTAYFAGRFDQLDGHRMPTWTLLAGFASSLGPALAGHLVNHLTQLVLPLVVYGLARASSVPASLSFAAGATVASNTVLIVSSRRFGVDPTIYLMLPLAMWACHLVRIRWWLAPIAGVIGGLATIAHFTTLPFAVPLTLAALVLARRGERLNALGGYLVALIGTLWAVFQVFPWLGFRLLIQSVGESASLQAPGVVAAPAWGDVFAKAADNAVHAVPTGLLSFAGKLNAPLLPDAVGAVLVVVGALGVGLESARGEPGGRSRWASAVPIRLRRWWRHRGGGIAAGFPILLGLSPVPVLLMMKAAPRYAETLLPLAVVLLLRGVASVFATVDAGALDRWRKWPAGRLTDVAGLAWAGGLVASVSGGVPTLILTDRLVERDLGLAMQANFPASSCVSAPIREAAAYAGFSYARSMCPTGTTEVEFSACIQAIRRSCAKGDTIAWMVVDGQVPDPRTAARKAMDAWVLSQFPLATELKRGALHVRIASIGPLAASAR